MRWKSMLMMQKLFENRKVGILIYRNEYATIAIGKRDSKSIQTKRVKPSVTRILGASSCFVMMDKKPPG